MSDEAIVLQGARLEGPVGLGTVIRVEDIEIAPLPVKHDDLDDLPGVIPGGIYETYPPVWRDSKNDPCLRGAVRSIEGYELEPQFDAFLAVRIRAVTRGSFEIHRHVVTYRTDGNLVQQSLEVGIKGEVEKAAHPRIDPAETSCLRETGAQLY